MPRRSRVRATVSGDSDPRPLIAHVVHRFDTGGLENGVVNLINRLDAQRFRHAVIALTTVTDFRQRIERPDVAFYSLNKPPGHPISQFGKWFALMRRIRPAVVHTRNLGAMEMQLPAAMAGVKVRIHGEHGRDLNDPEGRRKRYQWTRRAYRPLIHRYVALSRELQDYLAGPVAVPRPKINLITNGVDTARFSPSPTGAPVPIEGCPFDPTRDLILGTVGRLRSEKDQATLLEAFAQMRQSGQARSSRIRLVVAGVGPMGDELQASARELGIERWVWWAGECRDVPSLLRGLHVFALPSITEGISNTILEAMATGLPVVATDVGGNGELVQPGVTGALVPARDPRAMAHALGTLLDEGVRTATGRAARVRAETEFSLGRMVSRYEALYGQAIEQAR